MCAPSQRVCMIERKGAVPAVSFTMKDQQRLEVADSWTTNSSQALRMIQRIKHKISPAS